jgi:hypothetical protein
LRQFNYVLGFVFLNKYSLKITINKKWPKNQNDLEENKYESPTPIYCKEIYVMVPLVKTILQTPPRMQGSWSGDTIGMLIDVVESSRGVDNIPSPNVEGFPQYYHKQGH